LLENQQRYAGKPAYWLLENQHTWLPAIAPSKLPQPALLHPDDQPVSVLIAKIDRLVAIRHLDRDRSTAGDFLAVSLRIRQVEEWPFDDWLLPITIELDSTQVVRAFIRNAPVRPV
jgi:hypothetical protein